MNLTVEQVFANIQESAKQNICDERMIRTMEIGQHFRQGDVYLERVADDYTVGEEIQDRQIAEGNSKGSRHIMEGNVTMFKRSGNDILEGPTVRINERSVLTHPEHANVSIPSGTYKSRLQRDHMAEEIARVRD